VLVVEQKVDQRSRSGSYAPIADVRHPLDVVQERTS
jgi:hypothetical protein